ncbi:Kelch domain-containing protein 10 [Thelohanellus kitauei]|uniref:Kelch domain-containing protein 10 n=1 Tax=Thelohanellus kitauei TaxID=669202 RepID=A0A0C2JPA6_THEKT|nr:Kelch domain-containing protein 10 [Thelohanellus kitauei]
MNLRNEHTGPKNRLYHCGTTVREFLIIYGGYDCKEGVECNDLWIHNTINGVWKQYPTPIELKDTPVSSSICAIGNVVYIFGGQCLQDNHRPTNSLISFDINTATWKTVYPHTGGFDRGIPPPMYGNLIFSLNGSLYVLEGIHGLEKLNALYKFYLRTSTWSLVEQKGRKPLFVVGIFGTVFNNQLYCFGSSLPESDRFRDVSIFDFSTNTWTSRATTSKCQRYPSDRSNESFAFYSKFGYMSGGESLSELYSDIWKIDLESLEWSKMDYTLKKAVCDHYMAVIDECYLYSYGGFDTNLNYSNSLERIILRPPTLYRLCLQSICRSPNIRIYRQSLPPSIMDELNLNDDEPSIDGQN